MPKEVTPEGLSARPEGFVDQLPYTMKPPRKQRPPGHTGSNVSRQKATAVADRRRKAAELYLKHKPMSVIAKELGVSVESIQRDIRVMTTKWLQDSELAIGRVKVREVQELDAMERDCIEEFEKTRSHVWIDKRLDIKARRAKLLGLDVPIEVRGQINVLQLTEEIVVMVPPGTVLPAATAMALPATTTPPSDEGEVAWDDNSAAA